jgi:hypothetical protein
MAERAPTSDARVEEFRERVGEVCSVFETAPDDASGEEFLVALRLAQGCDFSDYVKAIQGLTPDISALGVEWLEHVVGVLCDEAGALLPALDLFGGAREPSWEE